MPIYPSIKQLDFNVKDIKKLTSENVSLNTLMQYDRKMTRFVALEAMESNLLIAITSPLFSVYILPV